MDAALQVLQARHQHHSGAVCSHQVHYTNLARLPPAACRPAQQRGQIRCSAAVVESQQQPARNEGHSALLSGLGAVGDVAASHMPWLLRIAHVRYTTCYFRQPGGLLVQGSDLVSCLAGPAPKAGTHSRRSRTMRAAWVCGRCEAGPAATRWPKVRPPRGRQHALCRWRSKGAWRLTTRPYAR